VFLEGAGASGRLSSSILTTDATGGEPHNCRTADTKADLSALASTDTRLACKYLNRNSFLTFRRFNRSEIINSILDAFSSGKGRIQQ